jgi:hypothetical protein
MPGKSGIQGAFSAYDSAELESISPHDGLGSAAPRRHRESSARPAARGKAPRPPGGPGGLRDGP